PLTVDFLEFDARCQPSSQPAELIVEWAGRGDYRDYRPALKPGEGAVKRSGISRPIKGRIKQAIPLPADGRYRPVRVRLSQYLHWFTSGQITGLTLELSGSKHIEIKDFRLVKNSVLVPKLEMHGAPQLNTGTFIMPAEAFAIVADAKNVAGAKSV